MADWREDCLRGLNDPVSDTSEFFARVAKITRRAGFDYCSIGLRRQLAAAPQTESWHTTYPQAWQRYYFAHDLLNTDPVIGAALHSPRPVIWEEGAFDGPDQFWDTAGEHGIEHGWTLALRGTQDETMLISLARSAETIGQNELAHKEPHLLWLAHSVLAMLVMPADGEAENDPDLSSREIEIIRWALAGKTAEETAIILGISTRTISFHMSTVMQKLDVVNKTQAVAKAVALHLID